MEKLCRPKPPNLLKFESEVFSQGFQNIAGVDEVGRGCLAGPVVAAAVILPWQEDFVGVNDSKKLSPQQREKLYPVIIERALAYGFGIVESEEIDRMNIGRASLKAMRLAIEAMKIKPDFVLVDGNQSIPLLTIQQQTIIRGDSLSLSVAAASILAKVKRDRMMVEFSQHYPAFLFEKHKGYGTKEHLAALRAHGPTPIHRKSFRGVVF